MAAGRIVRTRDDLWPQNRRALPVEAVDDLLARHLQRAVRVAGDLGDVFGSGRQEGMRLENRNGSAVFIHADGADKEVAAGPIAQCFSNGAHLPRRVPAHVDAPIPRASGQRADAMIRRVAVAAEAFNLRGQLILRSAPRQGRDLMTRSNEPFDDVAADEPGAAKHEHAHARRYCGRLNRPP